MAPGRARDERKERQWRRWIDRWRASGLSVRAFCARHGLASASFYNWRQVLEQRAAEGPAFVPVQVVADTDVLPAKASALEVVLVDGRAVRVAPGFDAATLRRRGDYLWNRSSAGLDSGAGFAVEAPRASWERSVVLTVADFSISFAVSVPVREEDRDANTVA